jgi:hypothetical protein
VLLRTIHVALMLSMALYVFMLRLVPSQNPEPPSRALVYALAAFAATTLVAGQSVRSRKLRVAFETLRTEPSDAKALGFWRVGVIVSDCCAEAVVLYGFVIHMLGGSNKEVAPFFVVGMAVMVFWWPQQP